LSEWEVGALRTMSYFINLFS